MNVFFNFTILSASVIVITLVFEYLSRKNEKRSEYFRKYMHFSVLVIAAFSPYIISNPHYLYGAGIAAAISTFILVRFNILSSIDDKTRKSWGIFYVSLSYLGLGVFLLPAYTGIFFISMLILAISDSTAALTGNYFDSRVFYITKDKKSILGSLSFFFTSMVLLLVSFLFYYDAIFASAGNNFVISFDSIIYLFVTAIILTIIEAASSGGTDNFLVPVFAGILLYIFVNDSSGSLTDPFLTGFILAGVVAFLSYKVKFLTLSGSISTFLLAGFIFSLGGWKWSIPILTFFVLSSLLSKLRKNKNSEIEEFFEKTGVRDHWQVLANGGLGGILVIVNYISPADIYYWMYIASLAAVCADTWATEIGTIKKTATYNIINFKSIEQGMSGGISILGTSGALLGAAIISLSGFYWAGVSFLEFIILITISGLIGSFFDSLLGATVQVQYRCNSCGKTTEKKNHCGIESVYKKGMIWMNNDMVNFFAGTAGLFFIIIYFLYD